MEIVIELQPILWSSMLAKELSQWVVFQLHDPRMFQSRLVKTCHVSGNMMCTAQVTCSFSENC